MPPAVTSRVPGFHGKSAQERAGHLADAVGLTPEEHALLEASLAGDADSPFPGTTLSSMVENVVGALALPMGIATNFTIDGEDRFVPMVIEEPSVVAAASNAARMARPHGGFTTEHVDGLMIGQVHLVGCDDAHQAAKRIEAARDEILALAEPDDSSLVARGGGTEDMEVRVLKRPDPHDGPPEQAVVVVHLLVDCLDAMGANAINTRVERIAPRLEEIGGGTARLRILSNLSDRRRAKATATFDRDMLGGEAVVDAIVEAQHLAELDPYRAVTHNKGVMNGVDAVVLATGNDWRAVEAGAHAWAARYGNYSALTHYHKDAHGHLVGELDIPLALGVVGGATKIHPMARLALRIMGVEHAHELERIACAVGLAQNLAALRALTTEGIQEGHMRLHRRVEGRS